MRQQIMLVPPIQINGLQSISVSLGRCGLECWGHGGAQQIADFLTACVDCWSLQGADCLL